ncbi:MAG: glycosyltransferase family 39 protein [Blastocatellia bacterium]
MAQTLKTAPPDFKVISCLLALVLLCGASFFFRLGYLPMIGPDEPRYTEVAREMYMRGDWITPQLAGQHWFEKPALTYWLVASGFQVLGVSELAARLPIALFSSFGVLLLFWFGRRLQSVRFGFFSAAALASSGIWLAFSRAATFDLPLAVAMAIALLAFFLWWHEGKTLFWYLGCCGMGLAMLAKGLVGILLPGVILCLFLLLTRTVGKLLKQPQLLLIGAVIFLLTIATWYLPMFLRHGHEFWQEFFVAHHFQRFLTNKFKHPQPFYFFTIVAILGCLPWSLFFLAEIGTTIKRWRALLTMPEQNLRLFLWLWIVVIVGFFSLSTSKLTGYILPVFPAIALLLGARLEQWWQQKPRTLWRWLLLLTWILLAVVSVVLSLRAEKISFVSPLLTLVLAATLLFVAFLGLTLLLLRGERAATLWLPFGLALSIVAATLTVMPGYANTESTAYIARVAKEAARPNERLVFFINTDFSMDFYAPELPLRDERAYPVTLMKPEEIAALLPQQPTKTLLVLSPKRWIKGIEDVMATTKIDDQYTWVLVRVAIRTPPAQ